METLFAEGHRGGAGPLRFVFATCEADTSPPHPSVQPVEPGVSVLFSVPKKIFKRAWKRNLIKRRMRESYRVRKHDLVAAALAAGQHIDIALICSPHAAKGATTTKGAPAEIPDFKTVDNAIEKILTKILERR